MKDLNELLAIAIGWEDWLTVYFDELEQSIDTPSCRRMLELLKDNHLKSCDILHGIHTEDFGADEWLACTPDDIDPRLFLEPLSDTSPSEVLRRLLDFEEAIQEFYSCIAGRVASRSQRDLFESLARSKERHIYEIRSCFDYVGGT